MATLDLLFDGKAFPVPKKSVLQLLGHHELFEAKTYAVQSSVPRDIFELFASSLKTQSKISVTKENAASLSFLAKEFLLPDLAAQCAVFYVPLDPIASLSERVAKLELQLSALSNPPGQKIEEMIEAQDRLLERLRMEVERQRESIDRTVGVAVSRVDGLEREIQNLRGEIQAVRDSIGADIGRPRSGPVKVAQPPSPVVIPPAVSSTDHVEQLPFLDGSPLNGIISFLTRKVGGNIHTRGIVNISSSGDRSKHCWQVADHDWTGYWGTANEPNSWISFDFKGRRVSLSHYTLKSHTGWRDFFVEWVIEGSHDSQSWMELDRRSTRDLASRSIVKTYPCSNTASTGFRHLRMRQTGPTSDNLHFLLLANIEFFGELREPR
jgi:hypothetical protein